jgi:adenylate cyclase
LEKEFTGDDKEAGASAVLCYMNGTTLYVANVGDALAVLSRNNGQALEISQKHIPLHPSEISRIRAAGGYVSRSGLLNNELNVSRSFGYYHLIPVVNPNPFISTIHLAENDEFVIMASRGLWDKMSYQTAVDIARTEKDDLMAAAQKLRDFALTYGADDNVMVMIVGVGDLFDKRDKRLRNLRLGSSRGNSVDPGDDTVIMPKNKRRNKEESPSDTVLARLDREVPPPTNQVALVFTDIKSSTLLWNTQPEDMRSAIKIHDQVMRRNLRSIGGYEVKTEGDAFMVCFQDTIAALLWCFTVQLQLLETDWPAGILETDEGKEIQKDETLLFRGLSVRMGIHVGTPVYERNPITKRMDYFGPVVNKASRICNAADGGQICVSSDIIAAIREVPGIFDEEDKLNTADLENAGSLNRDIQQLKRLGCHVVELGERRLKGLETPEMLSLVYPKELTGRIEDEVPSPVISITTPQNDEPSEPSSEQLSLAGRLDSEVNLNEVFSAQKSRLIDPGLAVSLNNIALRLEAVSALGETPPFYSKAFNQRIHESASDEELVMLIGNFVTRIEVKNKTRLFFLLILFF